MTSSRIVEVIQQANATGGDLTWLGAVCEGSKFHSPRPLLAKPFALTEAVELLDTPEAAAKLGGDSVLLCSTCRDNLVVYLSVLLCHDGATPQAVRRDFGNQIRALGDRAWDHHIKRSA